VWTIESISSSLVVSRGMEGDFNLRCLFSAGSSDILIMDLPLEKLELEGGGMEVPRTGTEDRELEEEGGIDMPLVGTEVVLLEM